MIKNKVKYILYASSSSSHSKQEEALLKLATDNGAYVFVSAGNDGKVIDSKNKLYPCSLKIKNLFCIGNRSNYSNKGDSVVLFDEGNELESCGLNNSKVKMKGTSQSTALFLGEFSKFIFK
jgi:subtilisin family serine protease